MLRSLFLPALLAASAFAQDLPHGKIIDDVKCKADATQSYALYVPSNYSADNKWSVILAFDPRGRGRIPVERFEAAAEKFGYIVAGSNNSRNGPAQVSLTASKAMLEDLQARFSIDPKRLYAAGQSGGARFAMDLALSTKQFAGVIASSAGFAHPRGGEVALDFAVFGTAGTDDFNYQEMRRFDRQLSSPHRVQIFAGDHTWLPSSLAVEALEWMEIQAMKSVARAKHDALIDHSFNSRRVQLAAMRDTGEIWRANKSLAADFEGLRDVKAFADAAAAFESSKDVRDARTISATEEMHESQYYAEISNFADQLGNPLQKEDSLAALKSRLGTLANQAKAAIDSPDRQLARRVIGAITADYAGRTEPEFRKMLEDARP